MKLVSLGNLSGYLVKFKDLTILVNCGIETCGIIRKLKDSEFENIDYIFVTHMHLDHICGIAPLLKTMATRKRTKPLNIIGPDNISNFVQSSFNNECDECFIEFDVIFHELSPNEPLCKCCTISYKFGIKTMKIKDYKVLLNKTQILDFVSVMRTNCGTFQSFVYILDKHKCLFFGDCKVGYAHKILVKTNEGKIDCVVHECHRCYSSETAKILDFFKELNPKRGYITQFQKNDDFEGSSTSNDKIILGEVYNIL